MEANNGLVDSVEDSSLHSAGSADSSDDQEEIASVPYIVIDDQGTALSLDSMAEVLATYNPSSAYWLGTSNVGIFQGFLSKIPLDSHYVYWRDSQYVYKFAYGDLLYNNQSFVGNGRVTVLTYSSYSGTGSYPYWSVSQDSSFRLNVGSSLVYSDLGPYPELSLERQVIRHEAVQTVFLVSCAIFFLVDRLRRSCIRGAR